jgi:hypothetical protein
MLSHHLLLCDVHYLNLFLPLESVSSLYTQSLATGLGEHVTVLNPSSLLEISNVTLSYLNLAALLIRDVKRFCSTNTRRVE